MNEDWFEVEWEEVCSICKGAGIIKGARNYVLCFHCGASGKIKVTACVTETVSVEEMKGVD